MAGRFPAMRGWKAWSSRLGLLSLALGLGGWMQAQFPQARLDTLFPAGGQPGHEMALTLTGEHLDQLSALMASHPGIQGTRIDTFDASSSHPGSWALSVSKEVPPGIYEVRAKGYFGVSNPRAFVVEDAPQAQKEGSPLQAHSAMPLEVGTALHAHTDERSVDHYRVRLKAGKHYHLTCLAAPLDSRLQPIVTLMDPIGKEVARGRPDGSLQHQASHEGGYLLRVHDAEYRGGAAYFYRLRMTEGFGEEQILPAPRPSDAPMRNALQPPRPQDRKRPFLPWNSLGLPVHQEGKTTPDDRSPMQPPLVIAGQWTAQGEEDIYPFHSGKGEVWWIEIFSHRLGHATSPTLRLEQVLSVSDGSTSYQTLQALYPSRDEPLGRPLSLTHRDIIHRFEAPEEGTYRIAVRDLHQHAMHPVSHPYQLVIRKPNPDFELVMAPAQRRTVEGDQRSIHPAEITLRPGGTWPLRIAALRRDGFDGAIALSLSGLPEGIHAMATTIPKDQREGWVFLTADPAQQAGSYPIRVQGSARIGETERRKEAHMITTVWPVGDFNNEAIVQRLTGESWLAIHGQEKPPVRIVSPTPQLTTTEGAELKIPLTLEWMEGVKDPLNLKPVGHPALAKAPTLEVKPSQGEATLTLQLEALKAPPGSMRLALRGQTKVTYRNQPEVVTLLQEKIATHKAEEQSMQQRLETLSSELEVQANSAEKEETHEAHRTLTQQLEDHAKALPQLEAQLKQAEERAKPKDLLWTLFSSPIEILIEPATEEASP